MDKDLQQRLDRLERLEQRILNDVEDVKDNIYAPERQKDYESYKGTLSQYMRESKLREVASGKKRTFANIAEALTGDREVAKIIGDFFDGKYTEQESEEAKKTLREEFGIKESKKKKPTSERYNKKLLDPITNSIQDLFKAVESTQAEIKTIHLSLDMLDKTITPIKDQLSAVVSGRTDSTKSIGDKLKPVTVEDQEGNQYLYYPDAPAGRQLYQKSKTGTAGRIASKKVQRKLKGQISEADRERKAAPIRKAESADLVDNVTMSVVSEIKRLLDTDGAVRKKELDELLEKVKFEINPKNPNSVFAEEPDEKKEQLKAALYESLKKVVEEHPELFDNSGGLLGDLPLNFKKGAKIPKTVGGAAGGAAAEGAIASEVGTSALGSVAIPILGALAATAATAFAFDSGMKSAGEDAIKKVAADTPENIAIALKNGYNKEYTRKRLHELAATDPALAIKLKSAEQMAGLIPAEKPSATPTAAQPTSSQLKPQQATTLVVEQKEDAMGKRIIDENQKKLEITQASSVTVPAQTVNNYNATSVIPVPTGDREITTSNPDNTFNRLLAQELNHPSTYSALVSG